MHTDKAERITITLPPDMLARIKSRVESGAYGSTSELIREAMRQWQRHEEEHQAHLESLRNRIVQSAASGTPVPLDEAFAQVERQRLTTPRS